MPFDKDGSGIDDEICKRDKVKRIDISLFDTMMMRLRVAIPPFFIFLKT